MSKPKYLTPAQAAKIVGLSSHHVRRMLRDGLIRSERIGWQYMIKEQWLKDVKRKRKLCANHIKQKEQL